MASSYPARWARMMTLVVKRQKTITERKNRTSRESITPFWMLSKWVITLNAAIVSTNHELAHCVNRSVTGGQPARMRKRQMTSETMKLTTWLRVIADVMAETDR